VTRPLWRIPFVLCAIVSLVWGVWLGLLRIGWALPLPRSDQLILHGPLMIGGFLGTLIGLERAVGLGRAWPYAAPAASGAGALLLVFGPPEYAAGALLITLASLIVCAVFATLVYWHADAPSMTMLVASTAWATGNVLWTAGVTISRLVFWWMAFLVLTIAGERLELNRLLKPTRWVRGSFVAAIVLVLAGVATIAAAPASGVRLTGGGFVALTVWLSLNDVARRTVRRPGVTRYIAVCMLTAYAWLGAAGIIALVSGVSDTGFVHDALLHAIFLGFAMTMVFGHAPIVFPAIARRPMPFSGAFYAPYALLQGSVVVRVAADLVDDLARYRSWGGLLNALALLLFVVTVLSSVGRGVRVSLSS